MTETVDVFGKLLHLYPFKRQLHKMVKHTQTILRQFADELFSVFDHFAGLLFKWLNVWLSSKFVSECPLKILPW